MKITIEQDTHFEWSDGKVIVDQSVTTEVDDESKSKLEEEALAKSIKEVSETLQENKNKFFTGFAQSAFNGGLK